MSAAPGTRKGKPTSTLTGCDADRLKKREDLTDMLLNACLEFNPDGIQQALDAGADPNQPNRNGLRAVHLLVDPNASDDDARQALGLEALLARGASLATRHNGFTVYGRISRHLPQCAKVVIEHHKGRPKAVQDMEAEDVIWWDEILAQWEASTIAGRTGGSNATPLPRRL